MESFLPTSKVKAWEHHSDNASLQAEKSHITFGHAWVQAAPLSPGLHAWLRRRRQRRASSGAVKAFVCSRVLMSR